MIENIKIALQLLLFGWGGVFLVLGMIYLTSLFLTKLFPVKK